MTKYLCTTLLAFGLLVGAGCDKKSEGEPDAGHQETDAGTDSGIDAGPSCTPPVDNQSTTFLNQGDCIDSRVECEPFDNTRIP